MTGEGADGEIGNQECRYMSTNDACYGNSARCAESGYVTSDLGIADSRAGPCILIGCELPERCDNGLACSLTLDADRAKNIFCRTA
jgi:hypothetical protein